MSDSLISYLINMDGYSTKLWLSAQLLKQLKPGKNRKQMASVLLLLHTTFSFTGPFCLSKRSHCANQHPLPLLCTGRNNCSNIDAMLCLKKHMTAAVVWNAWQFPTEPQTLQCKQTQHSCVTVPGRPGVSY